MAQTNFTPILIYGSGTTGNTPAAGNLTTGASGVELALNYFDGKLFYKDNAGVVQVLAVKMPSSILPVANGGTGLASYAAGDLLYATGATTLAKLTVGAASTILTSSGTAPQWTAGSSVTVGIATNLAGGVAGSLPYQTGANTTTFLGIGAADRVLTSTGTAPQWVTSLTGLTGVSSSGLTNTSLTSGRVVYSTTGGAQTDSANLTFDGSTLTVNSVNVGRGAGSVATNTAVGATSLNANTTGANNTALGHQALFSNTTSNNNTAVGYQSQYTGANAGANTSLGMYSLYSNAGDSNVAIGLTAIGNAANTGSSLVAVGRDALQGNTSGASNVAIGRSALFANTTASNNVAVGHQALQANTTASGNTAVGYQAAYLNTIGTRIVAIGTQAAYSTDTTGSVVAVGYQASNKNTTGFDLVAVGDSSLYSNTSGNQNIAAGSAALYSNTTGTGNVGVGHRALRYNTTSDFSTAIGHLALTASTGAYNTAVGGYALTSNTSGVQNTAVGGIDGILGPLGNNTTGSYNFAGGNGSLASNTSGSNNTGLGYQALRSNTTANNNTAVGYQAAYTNQTGASLTAVGYQALNASTGTTNTAIGYVSGSLITTGAKNTILGSYNGNQGGLDIRTSNNNIVLSDGDGNPRLYINGSGKLCVGTTSTSVEGAWVGTNSGAGISFSLRNNATATNTSVSLSLQTWTNDSTQSGVSSITSTRDSSAFGSTLTFSTTTGATGQTTERQRIDASGNVMWGTTTPLSLLTIRGADGQGIALQRPGSTEQHLLISTTSNVGSPTFTTTYDTGGTDMRFQTVTAAGTGGVISFLTNTAGSAAERLRIAAAGNVGIATTSPSYLLSLGGNSARTVGMERHTTADTAGNNLTLLAGGATSGATDKNGGNLVLSSGTATGSGSSIMTFLTTTAGAAGTADRSPTEKMRIDASGNVVVTGSGGLGYGTGSGGVVTQATSRTTGVTLDKTNGAITLVSAAGSVTWQSFTVTNNTVAATDTVIVNQKSGTDLYMIHVTNVAAGSFQITFATTGGTTTEQPVFNFAVIKAVTA